MHSENHDLKKVVKESLQNTTVDLGTDYAEIGMDAFLDNGILKEIPIVKTIVGAARGINAIREIFFAKKLCTFLREFHSGNLSEEKKIDFQFKFETDEKYKQEVIEQVLVMNDAFINVIKSKVLAKLFLSHLNGKFPWNDFCLLSEYLESLQTFGLTILESSATSSDPFHLYTWDEKNLDGGGVLFSAGICIVHGNHYTVNSIGRHLYYYGIKGDINWEFPEAYFGTEN